MADFANIMHQLKKNPAQALLLLTTHLGNLLHLCGTSHILTMSMSTMLRVDCLRIKLAVHAPQVLESVLIIPNLGTVFVGHCMGNHIMILQASSQLHQRWLRL